MKVLYTLLAILALLGAAVGGYRIHAWRQNVNERGFVAERTGTYVFGPSGVYVVSTGQELSRQQLFDVLLHNAVARTPELGFKK